MAGKVRKLRNPKAKQEPAGIGPALSRQLKEMHGGTIEAHSDGPDEGSEFIVRLPLAPAAVQPDAEQKPVRKRTDKPRKILIVDDNESLSRLLALSLRMQGHDVSTTSDPQKALEAVQFFVPDVILLDIGMPGLDGYQVAHQLKEHEVGRQPLLIAMTGYARDEDVRRSKAAGFDVHLKKPVDHTELDRLLEDLPERRN